MDTVKSPLPDEARKVTGDALQGALTDLIDLSLQGKQAHWNLVGRHFRSLHLQLDDVVAMARQHTDTVAERAVAIGVNPDGRIGTIARDSGLPRLEGGYIADITVVSGFVGIFESMVERFRERLGSVTKTDPVTENLFEDILHDLEKAHWMFQAQQLAAFNCVDVAAM